MSRSQAFLSWLDDKSDRLSPILVKEVRQVVRGREFNYAFGASLVAGLSVAFFGAADALTGRSATGGWTFIALMVCLSFVGLAVVPIGAFSALRNERLEQTLELITLTALSPRRVVIGKLLAQSVKLATLFAAIAPFITMSFLLGGIDFVTIVVSLVVLFMWSAWACAVCLFLSTLLKSRAMSGLVFGAVGLVLFLVYGLGRSLVFVARHGAFAGGSSVSLGIGTAGTQPWWVLAISTTFCLATMVNLVLLAENRLSLPAENKVTTLRVGFLVQFLLIIAWTLPFIDDPARVRSNAVAALGVIGGLHLAVVAMFTVTEDLVLSRRVLLSMKPSSPRHWLRAMFLPGGGRGAAYVLTQMALLFAAAWLFRPPWIQLRWLLAILGFIGFFTGVPTFIFRLLQPARPASLKLRVTVLLLVSASMLLPDIIHYVLWRPDVLDLGYSARHMLNPVRTLGNWRAVEARQLLPIPLAVGLTGLLAYLALIQLGVRMTVQPAPTDPQSSAAAAGEPGSASIIY
jgi:hypothetical protein